MTLPEIEMYVLTKEETAALEAAVSAAMATIFFSLLTETDDETADIADEVAGALASGIKKVKRLNNELRKGLAEARKERHVC